MYCTKCGKEISIDNKFCPYCGNPVANDCKDNTKDTDRSLKTRSNPTKFKFNKSIFIVAIIVAIVAIVLIAVMTTGGTSRTLSNKELKALAQEDGISPYDFKKQAKKQGNQSYRENVFSYLNAELSQFGKVSGNKTSGWDGVYLLTYANPLDTSVANDAYYDFFNIISNYNTRGARVESAFRNGDYSFFYIEMKSTIYGDLNFAFRIVGNSCIFSMLNTAYEQDPYSFLCSWDSSGICKMDQVDMDSLIDITAYFQ